jgi:hypothetical protein
LSVWRFYLLFHSVVGDIFIEEGKKKGLSRIEVSTVLSRSRRSKLVGALTRFPTINGFLFSQGKGKKSFSLFLCPIKVTHLKTATLFTRFSWYITFLIFWIAFSLLKNKIMSGAIRKGIMKNPIP